MNDLKKLKQEIFSDDPDESLAAGDKLASIRGDKVVRLLIPLLKNKNSRVRNVAAMALRDIGDNRAVKPLMVAIKKPENNHHTGTLVHALVYLDCSKLFLPMVELSLYGSYEVQNHALTILREQNFKTNEKEIKKAHGMIDKYLNSKVKVKDYEILIDELKEYILKIEKKLKNSKKKTI